MENRWTVPWSLATHSRLLSLLKLTQNMIAGCEPLKSGISRFPQVDQKMTAHLLSSVIMAPEAVSNTLISVPLVLAVATLVP